MLAAKLPLEIVPQPELFDGLPGVEAAGGFYPFMAEVVAEAKTTMLARCREDHDYPDFERCKQVWIQTLAEVLDRRLQNDMVDEFMEEQMQETAVQGIYDEPDLQAVLRVVRDRVDHRMEQRLYTVIAYLRS